MRRLLWILFACNQLARALESARTGNVVSWPRPAGDIEIEVLAIHYADSTSDR